MRLRLDHRKLTITSRLKLLGMRVLFGKSLVDVARSGFYRPEAGHRYYYRLQEEVLRGPSEWTVGERELMVAFISSKNHCEFCTVAHSELARKALKDRATVRSVVEEAELSRLEPRLRATLRFLERVSLYPWDVGTEHVDALREAGLTDRAIEDAVMVCVVFAIGNRLADTLGVEVPTERDVSRAAPYALRFGYRAYVG